MLITKENQKTAFTTLKDRFGYTNPMAAPRLMKIVVSSGVGKARDKNRNKLVSDRLAKITGQKPSERVAKKSIGYQVTLRGNRMRDFLDKLVNIALPRTRDFRGLSATAIDDMGNLTLGIRENTIFPETSEEDLKDVFGLSITLVTTANDKAEAEAFYRHLGLPLRVANVAA
jgi:large subunit ribosomal protein L5